ncbi:MAG TPA: helix-turn-helix domain-containing protein, partial [Candidatus Cybelea sp.]
MKEITSVLRVDDPFGPDEVQCPIRELLARVGGRWSLDVIVMLSRQTRHFADLERNLPGVSRRMLALTLRGLARDGLIARSTDSAPGERVYYSLTRLGAELGTHMRALAGWSQRNRVEIYAAREAFDR